MFNRIKILNKMASGWRMLSFLATGFLFKQVFNYYSSQTYAPLITAYMRRYESAIKGDMFEMTDRKREYYLIDDSQYMNYTEEDLKDMHMHANHGNQPDGEVLDSSYLVEVNKFLDGEKNDLKSHNKFVNWNYEFKDKSFPTPEAAKELIEGKL